MSIEDFTPDSMLALRNGYEDPSARALGSGLALARWTPDGAATLQLTVTDGQLAVESWGDGAEWIRRHAQALAGLEDRPELFQPADARMQRWLRRTPGLRLPRTPFVFDRVQQVVLLQLVTSVEGLRAWRNIVRQLGQPAPGPHGLIVPPRHNCWARTSEHTLIGLGTLPRHARTLRRVAREARRIDAAAARGPVDLVDVLQAIPGVGPWTVQSVLGSACGEPDAVPLGDYNLAHFVAWNLCGEERASDERMLALLEPYRGQRYRVLRLLGLHGKKPPRRGPRMRLRTPGFAPRSRR